MRLLNLRTRYQLVIAVALTLLGVLISLHYHQKVMLQGMVNYDEISYISAQANHHARLQDDGYIPTIKKILKQPESLVHVVSVVFTPFLMHTSYGHLPQVIFWCALYLLLYLKVASRGDRRVALVATASILFTFLFFNARRSAADFWLESIAIWVFAAANLCLIESSWFRIRRYAVLAGGLFAALLLYRFTLVFLALPGYLLIGLGAVVLGFMEYRKGRGDVALNMLKNLLLFSLPILLVGLFILYYQYDAVMHKLAAKYGFKTPQTIVQLLTGRVFGQEIGNREWLWQGAAFLLLIASAASIFWRRNYLLSAPLVQLLIIILGFFINSIWVLSANYHSYYMVMLIFIHLLMLYLLVSLQPVVQRRWVRNITLFGLLALLLFNLAPLYQNAGKETQRKIRQTKATRHLIRDITEVIEQHPGRTHVAVWFQENFMHLKNYYRFYLGKPFRKRRSGYMSTHGTFYTASRPEFTTADWVKLNIETIEKHNALVFIFCEKADLPKSKIYFTTPEVSLPILHGQIDYLNQSPNWQVVARIPYKKTQANICAYAKSGAQRG